MIMVAAGDGGASLTARSERGAAGAALGGRGEAGARALSLGPGAAACARPAREMAGLRTLTGGSLSSFR